MKFVHLDTVLGRAIESIRFRLVSKFYSGVVMSCKWQEWKTSSL